jgi:hypothetical protein
VDEVIECYANPLLGRERALTHATGRALATIAVPGDTVLVDASKALYEDEDYARASRCSPGVARKPGKPLSADLRYQLAWRTTGSVS